MTSIHSSELEAFSKRYRFGRSRILKLTQRGDRLDVVLKTRGAPKTLADSARPVKLHLHFTGVEEYRFQRRKGAAKPGGAVTFAFLEGMFFANFDSWPLEPGERPQAFDFRASDQFVAAKAVSFEELTRSTGPSTSA
jgi:hypothetical protein